MKTEGQKLAEAWEDLKREVRIAFRQEWRKLAVAWLVVVLVAFFCSGCTTTAPPDYFEGWRSVHVNKSLKLEPFTQDAPFDLREGASLE